MPEIEIIVVEDILEIRESLCERINQTPGLKCIADFEDPNAAIKYIHRRQPSIILMDIGLPYMSGIECMLRIKLKFQDIQFLMFTVFDHDDKVFEALKAGASGYILKESGAEGAVSAILELMEGGVPMSHVVAKKVMSSFHNFGPSNNQVEKLTPRQIEILQLLSEGYLYKEIADRLSPAISQGGVKQHINRIYKKLAVNNKIEAVNKWMKHSR